MQTTMESDHKQTSLVLSPLENYKIYKMEQTICITVVIIAITVEIGLAEATRDRGNDAHSSHCVIKISILLPVVSNSIGIYLTLLLPLR